VTKDGDRKRSRALIRRGSALAAGCAALASLPFVVTATSASAAPTQGVSSGSIRVGLPYLNLAALSAVGLSIDQGSYPDAFNALIDNLNAQGGINGRKVAPYLSLINPTSLSSSASACTQMAKDDSVFVVLTPLYPLCYQQAGVATINGTMGATLSPGAAPNFTLTPPPAAFDPLQLSVFSKQGIFKGKKVGVVSASTDKLEAPIVLAALKKLHVDVVQSAVDSAPQNDAEASDQQIQAIAERFKDSGVTVVVAVGSGTTGWLIGQNNNQSTYAPRLVATSYSSFAGTVTAKGGNNPMFLKGAVTASAFPSQQVFWNDPAIQKCVRVIKKAHPSTVIGSPIGAPANAPTTWVAAENTCQDVALFSDIAKAAGKNLTAQTFRKAGYGLRNVSIPGMGAPVSFGPGRAYAIGPVYLVTYNTKSKQLVIASRPTKT
jgi:hypothetical protein